jgi:hypothetical protein
MFLLQWDTLDLFLIALGIIVSAVVVFRITPAAAIYREAAFTRAQITSYDRDVPRYFMFAAIALVIGGAHTVIKSVPGFYNWLWEAGYGGHLFRDLSNSHIIIVGGGTVLLTGITWYVLPRWVNRPLYSNTLASLSLWFTVFGVFGFYTAWLILGLVEGEMVRQGWQYAAAKEYIGAWHRIPTGVTSGIMGVGYWTYVLNVALTIYVARFVKDKPDGYLTKFAAVSALALFVGTVQGVLQVLPDNAAWLLNAHKFGEYIDPISHAHINLVTGMVVSLGAFLVYFAPRMANRGQGALLRENANRLFWLLVPGSLVFYLAFLLIGLILGSATVGGGGLELPALVPFVSASSRLWLALGGSLMLVGFWFYFYLIARGLGYRNFFAALKQASPAGFWFLSALALFVGTLQGMLQVIPATAQLLVVAQEVPNIHAQLNMIGGILLALMGVVYVLLPELVGVQVSQRLRRLNLYGVAGGIGAYYVVVLASGLVRATWLRQGFTDAQAAAQLGALAPMLMLVAAVPMLVGYGAFGAAIFGATRASRAEWFGRWWDALAAYSGPLPPRVQKMPLGYILMIEFFAGVFGFPGLGWLYAGQAVVGVGLLCAGPAVAWALIPFLTSPFADTLFEPYGISVLFAWLGGTAVLSTCMLAAYYRLKRALARGPRGETSKPVAAVGAPAHAHPSE